MRCLVKSLLVLLIMICSLHGFAGTIDPNVSDQKYIKYAEGFNYVGKLCGVYDDGKNFCASAVAIDDHWIVTAAHVVKNSNECYLTIEDRVLCIDRVIYHKEFDKDELGRCDIALGYSEKKIGLKFYPQLYDKDDEVGKLCSIAGYGITGTFKSGANKSDLKMRAGSNRIDSIFRQTLVCSASTRCSRNATELEFLIASGDSGGGLFIDGKLAGINSFVMSDDKPDSTYGDECCHTRISVFKEWIRSIIE